MLQRDIYLKIIQHSALYNIVKFNQIKNKLKANISYQPLNMVFLGNLFNHCSWF